MRQFVEHLARVTQRGRFEVEDEEFDGDVSIGYEPSFENAGMDLLAMGGMIGVHVVDTIRIITN